MYIFFTLNHFFIWTITPITGYRPVHGRAQLACGGDMTRILFRYYILIPDYSRNTLLRFASLESFSMQSANSIPLSGKFRRIPFCSVRCCLESRTFCMRNTPCIY